MNWKRGLKAGLAVAYLMLLAASVEGVTRLMRLDERLLRPLLYSLDGGIQLCRPSENVDLHYELRRDSQVLDGGRRYTTNRLGFRDPQRSARKPPGVLRVVFLGSSNTYGALVDDFETYPAQLERLLSGTRGPRVEAWNAGVSAYVLSQEVELAKRIIARYQPDVMVFQHSNLGPRAFLSGQDFMPYFARDSRLYAENLSFLPWGERGVKLMRRSAFARAAAAGLNRTGLFERNNPLWHADAFNQERFVEFYSRRDIPILLMPSANTDAAVFKGAGVPLVPLFSRGNLPRIPYAEYFFIHPPACVYSWYARVLARQLGLGAPPADFAPSRDFCRREPQDWRFPRASGDTAWELAYAEEALARLCAEDPKDGGLRLARADAARRAGRHEDAAKHLGNALALQPEDPEYLERAAEICSGPVECAEALKQNERLTERAPGDASLRVLRAELAVRAGDQALARRSLAKARGKKTGARLKVRMAWVHEALGEPERASALWKEAAAGLWDVPVVLACAQAALKAGQKELALRCLDRAQAVGPSESEARRVLSMYRTLGEEGRSRPLHAALCRRFPDRVHLWVDRAKTEIAAGDRAGALESLARAEKAGGSEEETLRIAAMYRSLSESGRALAAGEDLIQRHPEHASSWVAHAEASAMAGLNAEALRSAERALGLDPSEDEALRVAGVFVRAGEHGRARSLSRDLARRHPDRVPFLIDQAEAAGAAGDSKAALQGLARAERAALSEEETLRIAKIYRALSESGRALAVVDDLIRRHPGHASSWVARAEASAMAGLNAEALRSAERALGLGPSEDEALRVAGVFVRAGEHGRAKSLVRDLARRHPDRALLWIEYAAAAAAAGERDAALEGLARAEKLSPSQDERERVIALLRSLGAGRQSPDLLRRAVDLSPNQVPLRLEYAAAAGAAGDRAAALESLKRAENLRASGDERHRIALAYQTLGEPGRCVAMLKALTREEPGRAPYWSDLGVCAYVSGRRDEAMESFAEALRLDPCFLPAARSLGPMLAAQGRKEEALRLYEKALSKPSPERWKALRAEVEAERLGLRGRTKSR